MNAIKALLRPSSLVTAALLGASSLSNATTIWTVEHSDNPLDFLEEGWSGSGGDLSYSSIWNLTSVGYSPATPGISGIEVWFAFADDQVVTKANKGPDDLNHGGDSEENVDVELGGTKIWNDLEVDGSHANGFAYYNLILNPTTHSAIFADLAADGKLAYTVTLQDLLADYGGYLLNEKYREDTYLKVAGIKAWYDAPNEEVPGVPDGGTTVSLMGLALLGLAGLRRKLA